MGGRPDAPTKDSVATDEIIDAQLLREYAPPCSAEGATLIDKIINAASPVPDKDEYSGMVARYPNNASYGGKYAMGVAAHRLSRNARNAAYRRRIVEVDMGNFRPVLLLKTPRGSKDPDGRPEGSVERSYLALGNTRPIIRSGGYFCEATTASGTKRRRGCSAEYFTAAGAQKGPCNSYTSWDARLSLSRHI